MRIEGAEGTEASPVYAFGLHLNPQVASYEPAYLVAVLRAFGLLNRKLRDQVQPDGLRKVLGWAEPHGPEYLSLLERSDYSPDQEQLITDYIQANPGRNYDLDMLTIFISLEEEPWMRTTFGTTETGNARTAALSSKAIGCDTRHARLISF